MSPQATLISAEANAVILGMLDEGFTMRLRVIGLEAWNVSFIRDEFYVGGRPRIVPDAGGSTVDAFCDVYSGDFFHLGVSGSIIRAAEDARECAKRLKEVA